MGSSKRRTRSGAVRLRWITAVAIGIGISLLLCAARAHAGSYTVTACEAAPDGQSNHSWWQGRSGAGYYTAVGCPNGGGGIRQGMLAMAGLNVALGNLAPGSAGWTRFDAPPGTTIANVRLSYEGQSVYPGQGWSSFIASSDNGFQGSRSPGNPHFDFLDGCTAFSFCGYYGGNFNGYWGTGSSHYWDLPAGTTSISATIGCEAGGGCPTGVNGASVTVHGAAVTLQDNVSPSMSNYRGLWGDTTWARGVRYVGFDATDVSGIKTAAIEVDPGTPQSLNAEAEMRTCDYTYAVPCERRGTATDFDTARVGDGAHRLRFVTMDTAGNWNTADTTIYTDNHAPTRPTLSVDDGDVWQMAPQWTVRWTNPQGQSSPITGAHWKVCPTDGGDCWTTHSTMNADEHSVGGAANFRTGDFGITQPGDYTLQLWLEDQAGNADSNTASDPIHLKFDNVPPGDAQPAHANGWINAQDAKDYPEAIKLVKPTGGSGVPASGIAGYAVTTDGSDPGTTVTHPGSESGVTIPMSSLREGHNTIKARAISGAGLVSSEVLSADLPVDLTPPSATVTGAPDPASWSTQDVTLSFHGTDQDALSGMAPGDPLKPVETGAYMTYTVDAGDPVMVPGDSATLTLSGDGAHMIRYQAYDLAGNPSDQGTVAVNIDKGNPNVVFNATDPARLDHLAATAFDQTSAIADGQILIRKVDGLTGKALVKGAKRCTKTRRRARQATRCTSRPAKRQRRVGKHQWAKNTAKRFSKNALAAGQWVPLGTQRDGNTFATDLDTSTLAPGTYQFEAVVHDAAGNEGIGTTYEDGSTAPIIVITGLPGRNGTNGANGSNVQASSSSSHSSVHCFGCGSFPTATIATKLTAGLVQPASNKVSVKVTKKCTKRSRHGKPKCKRTTTRSQVASAERLVGSRTVTYGQRARVKGQLTLGDGTPLGSQRVDVYEKLDAAGTAYREIGSVTTDGDGAFSFNAPAGPSRSLGFRYDGDHDRKAAEAAVKLRVPGVSTLTVNKHSVRNGQSVTFTGTVLGKPLPVKGKVIDLQAFYRGKWRSFATPRANNKGRWKYSYRFGATHGVIAYRFRAHLIAEAAYPYDVGYSKTTNVRVTGR